MLGLITIASVALAQEVPPNRYLDEFLAGANALEVGRIVEAEASFLACSKLAPKSSICEYYLACCAARLDAKVVALVHLRRAVERGYADDAVTRWDPDLASLRGTKEFDDLLARMHAQPIARSDARIIADSKSVADFGTPALSPDGMLLVLPMFDGSMRGVDIASGRTIATWTGGPKPLDSAVFTLDGSRISTVAENKSVTGFATISAWSARGGSPIASVSVSGSWWHPQEIFSADGRHGCIDSRDSSLHLWNANEAALGELLAPGGKIECHSFFTCSAFSPDGALLGLGTREGEVAVRDGHTGADPRVVFDSRKLPNPPTYRAVLSLAFHPTRRVLAVGLAAPGDPEFAKIEIVDLESGRIMQELHHSDVLFSSWAESLAFSPDGRVLVSTDCYQVYAWDWEHGRRLWRYDFDCGDEKPLRILFSADGARVHVFGHVACRTGTFDLATGKLFEMPERLLERTFVESASAHRLVTSGWHGTHVLDSSTLEELYTRLDLANDEFVLTTPTSYVDGPAHALRLCSVMSNGHARPLEEVAALHLDPKRVRAAAAGVGLRSAGSR